ncbi:MAG: TIGR02206 family membrane protein [Candidatus Kapabacteria bacterium]|nr:TIGR02206 family membrane protein [Candidatus Kapabacteria bacterium]
MVTFAPFTPVHGIFLAVTLALIGLPLVVARWQRTVARWIITSLLVWAASGAVLLITERGTARIVDVLPLHLCDLVLVIAAIAFFTRNQLLFELGYFYGIAGSVPALLTPDIAGTMPLWRVAYFFGAHAAVIAAVLYLLLVEQFRPARGAVWRAMAGLVVYVAAIGTFDALTGANYGYLCHKPSQPSLMDYLGPWPWYIGALGGIGLVLFGVLHRIAR